MKLNIHVISHPIVKYLSSLVKQNNLQINTKKQVLKQIGLFLTYESIRNWLKTYQLVIKTLDKTKNIVIISPKESFTIIVNTTEDINLIQELQYLLPECNIKFIPMEIINTTNNYYIKKNFSQINYTYTKIIIVNYHLQTQYILKLINQLINNNIKIHQIRLNCINCNTDQLIKISHKYPLLNIYTTEIHNTKT